MEVLKVSLYCSRVPLLKSLYTVVLPSLTVPYFCSLSQCLVT